MPKFLQSSFKEAAERWDLGRNNEVAGMRPDKIKMRLFWFPNFALPLGSFPNPPGILFWVHGGRRLIVIGSVPS